MCKMRMIRDFRKPKGIHIEKEYIHSEGRRIPLLILRPKQQREKAPGVLWIHGGGYFLGMKEMVYASRAVDFVRKFGAAVVSPGYRLALWKPYPAAFQDCYQALLFLKEQADRLRIRDDQIFVGGESAGGGLAAAVCMAARDEGTVHVAYQMPLYPMLDNWDTMSSANNHGRVWNTRKNHLGWRMYLRKHWRESVPPYASPARQTNYQGLPPAYTFVGDQEPFYAETLDYIEHLKQCGISAEVDVYPCNIHAFDLMKPEWEISRQAVDRCNEHFAYAAEHYFAPQEK